MGFAFPLGVKGFLWACSLETQATESIGYLVLIEESVVHIILTQREGIPRPSQKFADIKSFPVRTVSSSKEASVPISHHSFHCRQPLIQFIPLQMILFWTSDENHIVDGLSRQISLTCFQNPSNWSQFQWFTFLTEWPSITRLWHILYIYSPATALFGLRITMYERSYTNFSMENFLLSFRHMVFGCMLTLCLNFWVISCLPMSYTSLYPW